MNKGVILLQPKADYSLESIINLIGRPMARLNVTLKPLRFDHIYVF